MSEQKENIITKYPEGLEYLTKNIKMPFLYVLLGMKQKLIKSIILTIARQ